MKKLFIIMTLFMSSFFFLSLGKVKAYELEVNLDFSYIRENLSAMKSTVENFISTDETYSDNYMIYYDVRKNSFYAFFLPLNSSFKPYALINSSYVTIVLNDPACSFDRYSLGSTYIYKDSTVYSSFSEAYNFVGISGKVPIYSNFDIIMQKDSSLSSIIYKYNDFISVNTADGVDKFKTLYTLYQEYQNSLNTEDPVHKEELMKVENFYNVIIEKLSYLAETIVSNYIYLSIIAIFMLIFAFKLIFRRFL